MSAEWTEMFALARPLCATPALAALTKKRFGAHLEPVVAPNVIDLADFEPAVSRPSDITRIGYCGTRTHDKDMPLVLPAFMECAKLPNCTLTFFGWHPRWREIHGTEATGDAPPGRYEWQGLSYEYGGQFTDFWKFNQAIGALDVAVAPLADNDFNRSKSAQKFYEHAVHRTVTVFSDLPVYDCVEHGVTGFKAKTADQFTYFMRLLVEDAELRQRMGEAARQAVLSRHTTTQCSAQWKRAIHG